MLPANMVLRAQLAEIEAEIYELSSRLRLFEEARWSIKTQLDRVVYPVLSLPPEITAEIFLRCVPPTSTPVESKVQRICPHPRRAPLLLLQVCRTWRAIALSTPRLWDCLHLCDSTFRKEHSLTTMTEVITDWFGRAGSSPLTLSLDVSETQYRLGADAAMLSTILPPLASRLRCLWLDLDRVDELADVGPFPVLETFKISSHMYNPDSPLKSFAAAPRLHRVIFGRRATPSMFILPQAISEVTCHGFLTPDDLVQLLRNAPFLIKLACSILELSSPTEPFTHNHLETLRCNLQPFLEFLRLPTLQNLHLSDSYMNTADYAPSFLSSCPRLRRLFAHTVRSMSVDWFAAMPGLMAIDLTDPRQPFLSEFFASLDRTKDISFLPNLRTLTFRDAAFALDASVLQALSSRCTADEGTAMLEAFQLFPPRLNPGSSEEYLDDSTVAACRELVGRGISIHVGPMGKNWL
ncbi:hypothetical protein C8R46DRAFT_1359486 [Mycena filopes]|nr:hypothetical protein C8R46DRAFT_1359486 [Mycena filopes]